MEELVGKLSTGGGGSRLAGAEGGGELEEVLKLEKVERERWWWRRR